MSDKILKLFLVIVCLAFLRLLYVLPWRRLLKKRKTIVKDKTSKKLKTIVVLGSGIIFSFCVFM
jgi:hypothetical protein